MPKENKIIQPINDLSKNDDNESIIPAESNKSFINVIKENCEKIYKSLLIETSLYEPQNTFDLIKQMYINNNEQQLMYYTLSDYFFSLNATQHGIFISNIERLISHLETKKNDLVQSIGAPCFEKIYRFSLKMYDHSNLASKQLIQFNYKSGNVASFIQSKIDKRVNEKEKEIEKKFKSLEKDSITILGIFVAIILAFIGSIIFPIEIIESISKVSLVKFILLFSCISFIFINMLYLLIRFIVVINDKKDYLNNKSYIVSLNIGLFLIFVLSIVGIFYSDNLIELQQKVLANSVDYKQGLLDNKTK